MDGHQLFGAKDCLAPPIADGPALENQSFRDLFQDRRPVLLVVDLSPKGKQITDCQNLCLPRRWCSAVGTKPVRRDRNHRVVIAFAVITRYGGISQQCVVLHRAPIGFDLVTRLTHIPLFKNLTALDTNKYFRGHRKDKEHHQCEQQLLPDGQCSVHFRHARSRAPMFRSDVGVRYPIDTTKESSSIASAA